MRVAKSCAFWFDSTADVAQYQCQFLQYPIVHSTLLVASIFCLGVVVTWDAHLRSDALSSYLSYANTSYSCIVVVL